MWLASVLRGANCFNIKWLFSYVGLNCFTMSYWYGRWVSLFLFLYASIQSIDSILILTSYPALCPFNKVISNWQRSRRSIVTVDEQGQLDLCTNASTLSRCLLTTLLQMIFTWANFDNPIKSDSSRYLPNFPTHKSFITFTKFSPIKSWVNIYQEGNRKSDIEPWVPTHCD